MHQDLSSGPQHLHKKQRLVVHSCNPREMRDGSLALTGWPIYLNQLGLGLVRDPDSKNKIGNN